MSAEMASVGSEGAGTPSDLDGQRLPFCPRFAGRTVPAQGHKGLFGFFLRLSVQRRCMLIKGPGAKEMQVFKTQALLSGSS